MFDCPLTILTPSRFLGGGGWLKSQQGRPKRPISAFGLAWPGCNKMLRIAHRSTRQGPSSDSSSGAAKRITQPDQLLTIQVESTAARRQRLELGDGLGRWRNPSNSGIASGSKTANIALRWRICRYVADSRVSIKTHDFSLNGCIVKPAVPVSPRT